METVDLNGWITFSVASKMLGISDNAARVRARRGQLTMTRFGSGFHVLVRRDEVLAMAQNPPKRGRGYRDTAAKPTAMTAAMRQQMKR